MAGLLSFLAVSQLLPALHRTIGPVYTYLVFAVFALFGLGMSFFIIPETSGKSLEDLELFFAADEGLPSFETASLAEWL